MYNITTGNTRAALDSQQSTPADDEATGRLYGFPPWHSALIHALHFLNAVVRILVHSRIW
jgi:hypothetical protein